MKIRVLVFLFVCIILSCTDKVPKKNSKIDEINNKLEQSSNPNFGVANITEFTSLFEKRRIIDLETIEESLIGKIEDLIVIESEGKIVILDSQVSKSVLVFDLNGKFINKIGSSGNGPGEFIEPFSIAYGNNTIIVYSEKMLKLLFYKLDGEFIKEIQLGHDGYNFSFSQMLVNGKDLYGLTNNRYNNTNPNGKECKVIKIGNFRHFVNSYGKEETKLDLAGGGIVNFNNMIVFSNCFNGEIYEIDTQTDEEKVFSRLGNLFDIKGIESKKNPKNHFRKIFSSMDFIYNLGVINQYLFIMRTKKVTIVDSNGKIINELNSGYVIPDGYEGLTIRLGFSFYNKGIIVASTDKSRITESFVPNPSLIFYELKNK